MITKITISQSSTLTTDFNVINSEYLFRRMTEATNHANTYKAYSGIIQHLTIYPDATPAELFNGFLNIEAPAPKVYTKKRRTFTACGITITEEDQH